MIGDVPTGFDSVRTLARITLLRTTRSKTLFISLVIAILPLFFAALIHGFAGTAGPDAILWFELLVLALVPPMLVAASVGEELEERTSAYLWSRPVARWAVIVGKLVALVPIVIAMIVVGWLFAVKLGRGDWPTARSCVALAAGTTAASLVSAGIAALMPRFGMAFAVIYLIVDATVGIMPFSLAELSLTHQTRVLADVYGLEPALTTPITAMVIVSLVWSALGFLRIRRLEV